MSGNSGKLKTTLIGDYLHHRDLTELEEERVAYEDALQKLLTKKAEGVAAGVSKSKDSEVDEKKLSGGWFGKSDSKEKSSDKVTETAPKTFEMEQVDKAMKKVKDDYVPIDFMAYTIED